MPVRTGSAGARASAGIMPATRRSRTHATEAVDVHAEEAARFGSSHLTRVMREDLRKSIPAPPLPDAGELAEAVRQQDRDEQQRHRERDRQAEREYEAYLAGRSGKGQPEYDDAGDDGDDAGDDGDETVNITDAGDVVPARNPVRERLEREAAATRAASTTRGRKSDGLAALEREAAAAAQTIRTVAAAAPARPTHERLVARAAAADRESQLLTDAPAVPADTGLAARLCSLADVDRLWDWIRADSDSGTRFIGRALANSQQLHALMTMIAKGEQTRTSLARSIYLNDTHVGFVVLLPILITESMAAVHMYLQADTRGLLPRMLPSLLELAGDVMPDVKLAVMGMPPSLDKLLHAYGFRMQTVFLQE